MLRRPGPDMEQENMTALTDDQPLDLSAGAGAERTTH